MSAFDNILVEKLSSLTGLQLVPSATTTTLNGTLTLTNTSACAQVFTGTATGFTLILPDATTLPEGWKLELYNLSNQQIVIKDGSGAVLETLLANSNDYLFLSDNANAAGYWVRWQATIGTAIGLLNYNMTSDTAFTTSSATNVPITGFSFTPVSGKYAMWYNASIYYTTVPKSHFWSFYRGGSQLVNSARQQDTAHSNQNMYDSTQTIADFDGSQTVDVRVHCDNSGALTVNSRSMILIRVGPVG